MMNVKYGGPGTPFEDIPADVWVRCSDGQPAPAAPENFETCYHGLDVDFYVIPANT
jgi:hypothetical protein